MSPLLFAKSMGGAENVKYKFSTSFKNFDNGFFFFFLVNGRVCVHRFLNRWRLENKCFKDV